jgi:predicted dehydrogenase
MAETKRVRLGVVGCGAISNLYLPVLARRSDVELVAVADLNVETGTRAKERYHAGLCTTDYQAIIDHVDGVVICLPNALHAPVAVDCLRKGVGVLCEKPLATNVADGIRMVEEARKGNSILAAANVRRFYWSSNEVKQIIETKQFGDLLSIEAEEGEAFGWPTASGFFFDSSQSGGGVLIDVGSHLLDLLLWWLDGYPEPESVRYQDDNFGGVEADCAVEMYVRQTKVSVKLSRLAGLKNRCRLSFRDATVTVGPEDFDTVWVHRTGAEKGRKTPVRGPARGSLQLYFQRMISDFVRSLLSNTLPTVGGASVLPSIKLIEQCYTNARRVRLPWLQTEKDISNALNI